jgi:hypothetical protein
VFENRVLRSIFGPKRDEVTGEWRELHDLYSSPSIIRIMKARRMRWAGHGIRMEEKRNAYRLLVGKPEGRRPLGRPRRRWLDNIRMDLGEVGWGDVDWIGLAQGRDRWKALVNSVFNLRVPLYAGTKGSEAKQSKAIPVTGRPSLYCCETSRIRHCLDNRLIEGAEVVSLTCWPPFTPRKIFGTAFC